MSSYESTILPLESALHTYANKLTGCEATADDLVQETLIRAWRFWDRFEPGTSARAWVARIMRNVFIDSYHRDCRRTEIYELAAGSMHHDDTSLSPGGHSYMPSPDDLVDGARTREEVHQALEALPPDFRQAIVLVDIEGLTYREVAEVMDCPMGTVMSRIHRGRKILRAELEKHAGSVGVAA